MTIGRIKISLKILNISFLGDDDFLFLLYGNNVYLLVCSDNFMTAYSEFDLHGTTLYFVRVCIHLNSLSEWLQQYLDSLIRKQTQVSADGRTLISYQRTLGS